MKLTSLSAGEVRTDETGERRWIVWPGTGSKNVALHRRTINPGHRLAPHVHPNSEEVVTVLSGRGRAVTATEEHELTPGTVMYVPPGEQHSLVNVGEEPFVILAVVAPPDQARYK